MKKAFTLLEVNLAIMIMAGGILTILGLYGLGFRETRQSREDIVASAYADAVLSPLIMALSSPELDWTTFDKIKSYPSDNGWGDYLNSNGSVVKNPESLAKGAFSSVMNIVKAKSGVTQGWPNAVGGNLKAGLVVVRDEGSAVVRIAFRASRTPDDLLAMPVVYTEVRYQGKTKPVETDDKAKK